MKVLILVLLSLIYLWNLFLLMLDYRAAGNPVPLNVLDVYDRKTYRRWQAYHRDRTRLRAVSETVSFAIAFLLVRYDILAHIAPKEGVFLPLFSVLLFQSLVEGAVSAILGYAGETIEQRYGFSRTTMETFATDQLKEWGIGFGLSLALVSLFAWLHRALGDWILVVFAAVLVVLVVLVSFLFPYLSKVFNKFTPLEEGELRTRLSGLLTAHGYRVRDIMVMDASRRTTKSNAYFTGMGKTKTIVLYDTLLKALTPEEICAVFAHEVGHGLHHDMIRNQLVNFGNIAAMALLLWLNVHFAGSCAPFGFESLNYAFVYFLVGTVYMPLFTLVYDAVTHRASRRAEFLADRHAVEEGYGEALVSALKKISREDFACLSPEPLTVLLTYSHPTLSQRISAIDRIRKEKAAQ